MVEPFQGDLALLLNHAGRAGTPPVDEDAYMVDLVQLAGHDQVLPCTDGPSASCVFVVGGRRLVGQLRLDHAVVVAAPGLTLSQRAAHPGMPTVIDLSALTEGPWSGAATSVRGHLMDELLEVVAHTREEQALSYLIPGTDPTVVHRGTAALRQAADVNVTATLGDPDTEGSPASRLLNRLMEFNRASGQEEQY
ncbi:hypothetical protein F7P69_26770 [Cellulosimicrobium funkei]|nr:hypothetical protein [Cellulosimicrobium funkei]